MKKKSLTTHEIAKYCDVSPRTVVQWINEGKIKGYRTPGNHNRVLVEDFMELLRTYNMPVPPEFGDVETPQRRKRILIVDDDKNVAKSIQRALLLKGEYELELAFDGFDAGRKIIMFKPDLVILDIRMPGLNGFEVTKKIKSQERTSQIKIIVISAFFSEDAKEQLLSDGVNACLDKPFSQDELIQTIEDVLESQKTADK